MNDRIGPPMTPKQLAALAMIRLARGAEKYRLMCVLTGVSVVHAVEGCLRTADEIQSIFDQRLRCEQFTGIGEALIADHLRRM